jgi:glycine cleavage system H protein
MSNRCRKHLHKLFVMQYPCGRGDEISQVPDGLRYSKEHEWVKQEGENGRIGITDHAQDELTEIVFVELPKIGKKVKKGDALGVVESVKTVSDIYSPVSGEVIDANKALEDSPQLINQSPYDKGWFALIKLAEPSELSGLMDAASYKKATMD